MSSGNLQAPSGIDMSSGGTVAITSASASGSALDVFQSDAGPLTGPTIQARVSKGSFTSTVLSLSEGGNSLFTVSGHASKFCYNVRTMFQLYSSTGLWSWFSNFDKRWFDGDNGWIDCGVWCARRHGWRLSVDRKHVCFRGCCIIDHAFYIHWPRCVLVCESVYWHCHLSKAQCRQHCQNCHANAGRIQRRFQGLLFLFLTIR